MVIKKFWQKTTPTDFPNKDASDKKKFCIEFCLVELKEENAQEKQ